MNGFIFIVATLQVAAALEALRYSGLVSPNFGIPIPLKSVKSHATVRAWAFGVTAELSYFNEMNVTVESQFILPIADTAAVYRLEAVIGGRTLKAEVMERDEAANRYREGVSEGRRSILLEGQVGSPDVYRLMLGNLGPNETALVKIGFADQVMRNPETGELTVNLPVVLNPRYVPLHLRSNNSNATTSNFHSRTPYTAVSAIRYTFNFSADIDIGLSGNITNISPGNATDQLAISYWKNNKAANVTLTNAFVPDHDFRLRINISEIPEPSIYLEPGAEATTDDSGVVPWVSYDVAAAWLEPFGQVTSSPNQTRGEYWLVVDRSGSMSGNKIKSTRTALILLIKSLPEDCKFNIIGFGSYYQPLFPSSSVNYTETTADQAIAYAEQLDSDYLGTEILEPLEYIYSTRPTEGGRRFILLLTDGEVYNTEEVIAAVQRNAATTRVFAVGIGEGASTALINGVARVSSGLSEFVSGSMGNSELQSKVISILKTTTVGSIDGVTLEWETTGKDELVMTTPSEIQTAALVGKSIMQFAVYRRLGPAFQGTFDFRATVASQPVQSSHVFSTSSLTDLDDPMPLHRIAAKIKLVELEDQYRLSNDTRRTDIREEGISISKSTGVLCQFTSMVAVDSETNLQINQSGSPIFVEIERPTSYLPEEEDEDQDDIYHYSANYPASLYARAASYYWGSYGGLSDDDDDEDLWSWTPQSRLPARSGLPGAIGSSSPSSDFSKLVLLQSFDGYWRLTAEFVAAVNAPQIGNVTAMHSAATPTLQENVNDETLATLTGLAVLRTRFGGRQNEWQFLETKAVRYLTQQGYSDIDNMVATVGKSLGL